MCSSDLCPGIVDENATHSLGGNGKEVSPILIRDYLAAQKPDTEFVDERTGLKCMVCPFPLEEISRYLPQCNMDGFEQFLTSLLIAVAPERKPSRNLLRICHPSLRMAGPEMRPRATGFRYYRWGFCVFARAAATAASEGNE